MLLPSEDGHNWPKHVKTLYKQIYTKSHWTVLLNHFINNLSAEVFLPYMNAKSVLPTDAERSYAWRHDWVV
jgi:hypothetical protein